MGWRGKVLMIAGLAFLAAAGIGLSRGHGAGQCGIGGGAHGEDNPHPAATCGVGHGDAGTARVEKDCPTAGMDEDLKASIASLSAARDALSVGDTEAASRALEAAAGRLTALRDKVAGHCPMEKAAGRPRGVKCPLTGSEIDTGGKKPAQLEEASGETRPEDIQWHRDPVDAFAEAARRDTLVVADFYAEWCGWCKRLEAQTLSDPEVRAALRDFTLLKIDTDRKPELAHRFGVRGLPTTVIIDAGGETVLSRAGFMPPEDYLRMLKSVQ